MKSTGIIIFAVGFWYFYSEVLRVMMDQKVYLFKSIPILIIGNMIMVLGLLVLTLWRR